MRVVVAGASGLIGTRLVEVLTARGHEITRLVRRPAAGPGEASWNPGRGDLDPGVLEGAGAVVCLSGANVGRLPWTSRYRTTLITSRIGATRTLADALLQMGTEAPALLSASAVGFYGSRPGERLTEADGPGDTFFARLCTWWEREARRAEEVSRVALLRTAPVLDPGGVLAPLMRLTALGLGGPIGSGTQVWPWISLEDEARAICHILEHPIRGPVNLSAPESATADDIGRELARALRRPFLLPAPEAALRLVLGRDATESLLTADAWVVPEVLSSTGFEFSHPGVRAAIAAALT